MANWDVVVVGGINTDYLIRGETFPGPGRTVEGEVFQQAPGGKGANQAVAAARLGAKVAFVGRVGPGARGEAMIEALRAEGVDTHHILREAHEETGAALIMVDRTGEKQILTAPGANRKVTVYDILKAEPLIRASRVLLTQFEIPLLAVAEALKIARANGVRTVLDPAPPQVLEKPLLQNVEFIRPNADEAHALTAIRITDRASARAAADTLLAQGVQAVAVQVGSDGDLLVSKEGEHFLSRISVETVDATGAGDAFAAALAVGLAQQKTYVEAARMANAAAALATTKVGAQAGLPTAQEVQHLLAKIAA